jgi:hypothetical protein
LICLFEIFLWFIDRKKIRILKNALEIGDYIQKRHKINTVPSIVRKLLEDTTYLDNISIINMAGEVCLLILLKNYRQKYWG